MKHGVLFFLIVFISGCAGRYGCPTPKGVTCQRISDVYANDRVRQPGVWRDDIQGKAVGDEGSVKNLSLPAPGPQAPSPALPIRTAPKILRVWIAPWIDQEGDLHKEGDLFLVVHTGKWTMGESVPKEGTFLQGGLSKMPSDLSSGNTSNESDPSPLIPPNKEKGGVDEP